jgi:hypothetical protein
MAEPQELDSITARALLDQLLAHDTSGLGSAADDDLRMVRNPYRQIKDQLEADLIEKDKETYDAILAEMAQRGISA